MKSLSIISSTMYNLIAYEVWPIVKNNVRGKVKDQVFNDAMENLLKSIGNLNKNKLKKQYEWRKI